LRTQSMQSAGNAIRDHDVPWKVEQHCVCTFAPNRPFVHSPPALTSGLRLAGLLRRTGAELVHGHGEAPAQDESVDSYALERRVALKIFIDKSTSVASN